MFFVFLSLIRFFLFWNFAHFGTLIMWGSVSLVSPSGEDPLAEGRYNMDTVAGVLKLYFRGMENPLFPTETTYKLLELAGECMFAYEHAEFGHKAGAYI